MNLEEKLKLNSAVAQILVEYEKIYGRKKAREMFDCLISQLVKVFESYVCSLVIERIELEKEVARRLFVHFDYSGRNFDELNPVEQSKYYSVASDLIERMVKFLKKIGKIEL